MQVEFLLFFLNNRISGFENNLALYGVVSGLWSSFYALGYVSLLWKGLTIEIASFVEIVPNIPNDEMEINPIPPKDPSRAGSG